MYTGWCRLEKAELTNSARQYAYASANGLNWLSNCDSCESLDLLLPYTLDDASVSYSGAYQSVKADPAPWYRADDPDSLGFFGISLLEMTGVEDDMRTVTMQASILGGGSAGKAYFKHRECVMKVLLVAEDECSLDYGLRWLKSIITPADKCQGTQFAYYACCPCLCEAPVRVGDCYLDCSDECIAECVNPYYRYLDGVRITSGPLVLQRLNNLSCGAGMTVEMTLVAGNPLIYGQPAVLLSTDVVEGDEHRDSAVVRYPSIDPFRPDVEPVEMDDFPRELIPSEWVRTSLSVDTTSLESGSLAPTLAMTAEHGDVAGLRVGLKSSSGTVGSWFVRYIPDGGTVYLEPITGKVEVEYQGVSSTRHDIVIGGDGGPPQWTSPLDIDEELQVVVDRVGSSPVKMDMYVSTVSY